MAFRWYNWIGLAMLLFGGLISEPVFLEADSGVSSLWFIAAVWLMVGAVLVLWQGKEDPTEA